MAQPHAGGGVVNDARFTVGAEAGNVITVHVDLLINGSDPDQRVGVAYWLSSDATGDTLASDPGTTAAGTDGTIVAEWVDDICGFVLSEADGDIDIAITHSGTSGFYLNLALPTGRVVTSPIAQFA